MLHAMSWKEHCLSETLLLFLLTGLFILPSVTSQICHDVLQQSKSFLCYYFFNYLHVQMFHLKILNYIVIRLQWSHVVYRCYVSPACKYDSIKVIATLKFTLVLRVKVLEKCK